MRDHIINYKYAALIQDATYNMEELLQIRGRIERDTDLTEENQLILMGMCELRMDELYKRMCDY